MECKEENRPRSVGKWQSPDSASPSKGPAWLLGFLRDCRRSVPCLADHHKLFIVCRNTTTVYILGTHVVFVLVGHLLISNMLTARSEKDSG